MDFASTGNALSFEASVATVKQLEGLDKLVAKAEADGPAVLADAELRASLARIASALGTDPLQLDLKGLKPTQQRAERENKVGVAVVEACRDLQAQTGGSVPVAQLVQRLTRFLGFAVSTTDVLTAVDRLAVLGPGLRIEKLPNGTPVVRSVAGELSTDQGTVLAACDALGFVTVDLLVDNLAWQADAAEEVLGQMLANGLLWIDEQCAPTQYWTPSVL